jgi:hypothetical protein
LYRKAFNCNYTFGTGTKLYVRTLAAGRPSGPHLIKAFPPITGTGKENIRERVVNTSLQRFSRPRGEVETRIRKFLSG